MNILDIDSAAIDAEAKAQQWELEFIAKWNEPIIRAALLAQFLANPEAADPRMAKAAKQMQARIKE